MLLLGEEVERVCGNDCDELCKMGVKEEVTNVLKIP